MPADQGVGLARHASINLVGGLFSPVASFATAPILAHALSVDGRGELAAATMPLAVTVTIATLGIPEAVTYFVARDRRRTRRLLLHGATLTVVPAAAATAALVLVAAWISGGNATVQHLIALSAVLIVPSLLLSVVRAVAAAHNMWTAITIERVLTAGSKLVTLVILLLIGHLDLVSAAIVTVASTLVGSVAYVPFMVLRGPRVASDRVATADLLKYGASIWIGSVFGILLMRIDQVLMSPLAGAFELGLYAVAVSIGELPLMVNTAIRETAFTHLSDRGVRAAEVGDLSRISTIVVFALCLPVGALSPVIVPLLFGQEFSGAVSVLLILLCAACLGNPGSIAGVGLSSAGYPHLRSSALAVACIANVAVVFTLAPVLGAIGAALATLVGNVVASNICVAWVIRRCGGRISDFYRFRTSDFLKVRDLMKSLAVAFLRRKPS